MYLSQIVCLGLSHHTAPLAVREHVNRALENLQALSQGNPLGPHDHVAESDCPHTWLLRELVILSTCNRAEIYACLNAGDEDPGLALRHFLEHACGIDPDIVGDRLYCYRGREAVNHLCRVAAGLDSLVLGESEILGQVTRAYTGSIEARTSGPVLSALFLAAMRAGKRTKTETTISTSPASMSSVALALAEKVTGDLRRQRLLVIGLGEMGQLTLKILRSRGIVEISVANRSPARARAAADQWGVQAYGMDELPQAFASSDVVICATAAQHPVVTATTITRALAMAPNHKWVIVDIAVPRDVAADVRNLPEVSLFDVDDLRGQLDESMTHRRQEIPRVEAIIEEEIAALEREYRKLAVKPVIVELRQRAEQIRLQELERTMRYLRNADPETQKHIQRLSCALVNKLLHEPTVRLKQRAEGQQAAAYASTVRDLFQLDGSADTGNGLLAASVEGGRMD